MGGLRLPEAILVDQGVGEHDELAGDGDGGGFGDLPAVSSRW